MLNNIKVYGFNESIKASKYPMSTDIEKLDEKITGTVKKLGGSKKGEGHDNFLNGIVVQFDLTFTVKAWTELQRYHFIDFVSSQSTMHRIASFDIEESYIEYVNKDIIETMKEIIEKYNSLSENVSKSLESDYLGMEIKNGVYNHKEFLKYNKSDAEKELKRMYLEILYSNPCGFKLTARMTTNYRQLKTMHSQRKNHRLPEWVEFCKHIEELPMFKELCLDE